MASEREELIRAANALCGAVPRPLETLPQAQHLLRELMRFLVVLERFLEAHADCVPRSPLLERLAGYRVVHVMECPFPERELLVALLEREAEGPP